jgi:hypothetical protein
MGVGIRSVGWGTPTTVAAASCTIPSDSAVGDRVVIIESSYSSSVTATPTNTGSALTYTVIKDNAASSNQARLKTWQTTLVDAGACTFTCTASAAPGVGVHRVGYIVFSGGYDLSTFINGTPTSVVSTSAVPVCPSLTTTADGALVVVIFTGGLTVSFTYSDSTNFSELSESGANSGVAGYYSNTQIQTRTLATAGATGTATAVPSSTPTVNGGVMFAITPSVGGGRNRRKRTRQRRYMSVR